MTFLLFQPTQKVISVGLYDSIYNSDLEKARQSPAYKFFQLYGMTGVQFGEVFDYVLKTGRNEREGICQWVIDNLDFAKELIPRTCPRTCPRVIHYGSGSNALRSPAYAIGAIATTTVLGTICCVY